MSDSGGVRVLVIDDDADLRTLIRDYLEYEGYEVATAADGREGLESQRARPADVVVTDIFMPGKEGIQTIAELRRDFPRTKIIAMSGGGELIDVDYLTVARHVGAAMSLKKPFRLEQLAAAMRELR
jgi:DNA-binding response OmpR family regulator